MRCLVSMLAGDVSYVIIFVIFLQYVDPVHNVVKEMIFFLYLCVF